MNDLILAVNGYRPSKDYLRVLYTSGACVFAGGGIHAADQSGGDHRSEQSFFVQVNRLHSFNAAQPA